MSKHLINVDENSKKISKNKTFTKLSLKGISCIKFHFSNGEDLSIDKNQILSLNPNLLNNSNFSIKNLSDNSFQINLPNSMKKEEFSLYLSIIGEGETKSLKSENIFLIDDDKDKKANKILNLLQISDYFHNEDFNIKFINEIILRHNYDNIIIELLDYSYKKLSLNSQKEQVNSAYFDLFYQSLENISKNEKIVLENLDKIKYLDQKIIDEIIEKTFKNLIYGTTLLIDKNDDIKNFKEEFEPNSNELTINNNLLISPIEKNFNEAHILKEKQFKELIYFLMEIKNKKNFFDLLTAEYAFLLSKESINELKSVPYPSLQVDIHFSEYSYYSQEFPLEIILNHKNIIVVVSYKKLDQSFNVCLKLSNHNTKKTCNSILEIDNITEEKFIEDNSCFKIFTFLTHVIITKGPERIKIVTQNNLLSLSNNKTLYSILKISNFDNELRNFLVREPEKEFFSVIVHVKLCYVYSALASFLLKEFSDYSKDPSVCKISKQLLILILENKYLRLKDKDIIETILLWLQDEINIKEDISKILELIKWEEIEDSLVFELIIKYSHIIVGNNILEKKILDSFEKKYNNPFITGNILKSLFIAGQKIEYNRIFSQMKKSEKYKKSHKYFGSESKFKGIFLGTENSSLSKESNSLDDGIQTLLMNNSINNQKFKSNNKKDNDNDNYNYNYNYNNKNRNINEKKDNIINNNVKNNISAKIHSDLNINNNNENTSINNNTKNNLSLKNNKSNNKFKKNDLNKDKRKAKDIFYKNNAHFLNKNLSFLNIKQQKNQVKPNLNKNLKNNNIKKLSFSYIKTTQNGNSMNNKNNISNVSININNISNINISNNNYSNYKTQNNDFYIKDYSHKPNANSFSLTFFSGKSQEKFGQHKNSYKKYEKNLSNLHFKLFSTGNSDININNKKVKKINDIKRNSNQKSQKNKKQFNSLLSTILNYDKLMNKSKHTYKPNKNCISIKKMVLCKNPKRNAKEKSK